MNIALELSAIDRMQELDRLLDEFLPGFVMPSDPGKYIDGTREETNDYFHRRALYEAAVFLRDTVHLRERDEYVNIIEYCRKCVELSNRISDEAPKMHQPINCTLDVEKLLRRNFLECEMRNWKLVHPPGEGVFKNFACPTMAFFPCRHIDTVQFYPWGGMGLANGIESPCLTLVNTVLKTQANDGKPHVVVAGGAVVAEMFGTSTGDIDFFIYGLDPEEFNKYITTLVLLINRKYLRLSDLNETIVSRSKNAITITFMRKDFENKLYPNNDWMTFQFILRCFPTMESVVGGFDIGACQCLYDGEQIWCTKLAHWELANLTTIVNISKESPSHALRLRKYHLGNSRRQFSLLLPGHTRAPSPDVESSAQVLAKLASIPLVDLEYITTHVWKDVNRILVDDGFLAVGSDMQIEQNSHDKHAEEMVEQFLPCGSHRTKIFLEKEILLRPQSRSLFNELDSCGLSEFTRRRICYMVKNGLVHAKYVRVGKISYIPEARHIGIAVMSVQHPKSHEEQPLSDYDQSYSALHIDRSNFDALRRRKGACTQIVMRHEDNYSAKFFADLGNPNVPICLLDVALVERTLEHIKAKDFATYATKVKLLYRLCGPIARGMIEGSERNLSWICHKINQNVLRNLIDAREELIGLNPLVENPGRQWTCSFQPIHGRNGSWYAEKDPATGKIVCDRWNGFSIGLSHGTFITIVAALRCEANANHPWRILPWNVWCAVLFPRLRNLEMIHWLETTKETKKGAALLEGAIAELVENM